MSVLFVCLGNICRSPMAHGVMLQRAAARGRALHVDSAGTISTHAGERPDPRTLDVLARHGVPLDHRSRRVRDDDFANFDLILAMDHSNRTDLLARCPAEHAHKVRLVLEPIGGGIVKDPYYGGPSGFDLAYEQLTRACDAWLDTL